MRRLKTWAFPEKNSMAYWWQVKNPAKTIFNFVLIYSARYSPSLALKRMLYRLAGAKIGQDASVGLGAIIDIFYPELVEVGDNSIIGYNTVILAHEFLVHELRTGNVKIGKNVMIGANCTILAGVNIGDGATVSACSLVNSDIPKGAFAGGIPARVIKKGKYLLE
jgi:acetyltransferase-like isoleucine patch superfamily enzyme